MSKGLKVTIWILCSVVFIVTLYVVVQRVPIIPLTIISEDMSGNELRETRCRVSLSTVSRVRFLDKTNKIFSELQEYNVKASATPPDFKDFIVTGDWDLLSAVAFLETPGLPENLLDHGFKTISVKGNSFETIYLELKDVR